MRSRMIGVVSGILITGVLPVLPGPWQTLLPALLLLRSKHALLSFLSGILLGVTIASIYGGSLLDARFPGDCVGEQVRIQGLVASLPRGTDMGLERQRQRFELQVEQVSPEACAGPRRVLLSYYGDEPVRPGQRWQMESRLRKPWGLSNPGSFNFQAWYAQTGIDAVGSVTAGGATLLPARRGIGPWPMQQRYRISAEVGHAGIPGRSAAILRALVVADKSGIDHSLWTLFQQYGINHLLVISGLHVGMVAGLGYLLGNLAGRLAQAAGMPSAYWGEVAAIATATIYAMLAGFSVATLRALVMLVCFMLARISGRYSGSVNNLLLAALCVLLLNPLAGLGSGLWLSFTAVAALLWLGFWYPLQGFVARALGAHLFMALLMVPVGGFWFGGSSWVSAPANLFMVPLVGFYVVPLSLLGALAAMLHWPVADLFWRWAALPLDYLLGAAERLPGQGWFLHLAPGLPATILGLCAVLLLVLPLPPGRKLVILVLLLPLLLPLRTGDSPPQLTVLDVGQGTSVVFTSGSRALLYDTGGGNPGGANLAQMVVLPYLRNRGIRALDTLVISHGDLDHSAGLGTVMAAMPVSRLWTGGMEGTGRPCVAGMAWRWPDRVNFRFLSPALEPGLSSNNSSCVLSIEFGPYRLLLAGDIEASQERELIRYWQRELGSDVLVLAHHGSKTSSSQGWLNRVDPSVAVVSSAYASRFAHPHPVVMGRVAGQGVAIRQTSREGALLFEFPEDGNIAITGWREGSKPWWM